MGIVYFRADIIRSIGIHLLVAVLSFVAVALFVDDAHAGHQDGDVHLGCNYAGTTLVSGDTWATHGTTDAGCADWMISTVSYWTGSQYLNEGPEYCYGPTHSICYAAHSTLVYAYGYTQIEIYSEGMLIPSETVETFYPH